MGRKCENCIKALGNYQSMMNIYILKEEKRSELKPTIEKAISELKECVSPDLRDMMETFGFWEYERMCKDIAKTCQLEKE
jgi:hypothetical protein